MNVYAVKAGSQLISDFPLDDDMVIDSYPTNGGIVVVANDAGYAASIIAAEVTKHIPEEEYTPGTLTQISTSSVAGVILFSIGY